MEPKPTQLSFYPGHWRDVLETAKFNFRGWLACKNAFPSRQTHLQGEARESVAEARAEHQENGFSLGGGKFLPASSRPPNLIPAF
jgi:hypothetical protein